MKIRASWVVGAVAAVGFLAALPSSLTIVGGEEIAERQAVEEFDPVAFVDGIWESQIVPTVRDEAVELTELLGSFDVDAAGNAEKVGMTEVAERLGLITVGEAHVYMVRGRGTVTAADDKGIVTIDLVGYDGPIEVQMYMGTRIPSDESGVRDAVGFIQFGDFKEQTEYGKVASEINRRIVSDVIGPFQDVDIVGASLAFSGAIAIRTFNVVEIDLSAVRIVPVEIEQAG